MKTTNLIALSLASLTTSALAEVKLNNIFSDHMVLQRDQPVRVFGSATPGEKITVTFNGKSATAQAASDGTWRADLPAVNGTGGNHTLTASGKENTVSVKDVTLGEVWICSGQSNMEWTMGGTLNPDQEIAAANFPDIRLFDVPGHTTSPTPNQNTPGTWQVCTPDTVRGFSAVGFFFGQKLHAELGVPIGLVGTNWGGTRIEPWTPPVGFDSVPELADYSNKLKSLDPSTPQGQQRFTSYLEQVESWAANARKSLAENRHPGSPPNPPDHGEVQGATTIYNAMVNGLKPFSVRGAIWYQGESNAGDGEEYADKKRALVQGWRSVFENDELAFYWVQLANFQQPNDNPAGGGWGAVREGQRRAMQIPNTGMAVIIDIGEANDIHPRNKQDVGRRLALWPLHDLYGKSDVVPSGPLYKSMKVEGDKIRLDFDHIGGGLMVGKKDGLEPTKPSDAPLGEFAVSDAEGNWHWAEATIDGDTVLVSAADVKKPTNVRYAFQSNPTKANLYNKAGLPASPFRTGD